MIGINIQVKIIQRFKAFYCHCTGHNKMVSQQHLLVYIV